MPPHAPDRRLPLLQEYVAAATRQGGIVGPVVPYRFEFYLEGPLAAPSAAAAGAAAAADGKAAPDAAPTAAGAASGGKAAGEGAQATAGSEEAGEEEEQGEEDDLDARLRHVSLTLPPPVRALPAIVLPAKPCPACPPCSESCCMPYV